MKNIYCFITLLFFFNSCCFITSSKCILSEYSATFKIVDRVTERDLIFGQFKRYDLDSIKLFSLSGNDTIFYNLYGSSYTGSTQDSLMYSTFNYTRVSTVFVKLSSSDIDTLSLRYQIIDPKSCCEECSYPDLVSYNLNGVRNDGRFYTLFK